MGNRANYVLIENGQRHIFFSRWGALNIPAVLLAGPEATQAYIRGLTPDNVLLDNIWAEGGVVLDVDTRKMLFWGGNNISTHPYLRRPFLAVLPSLWPGWSVDWALYGVADLARSIDWDISRVLESEYDDTAFLTGDGAVATDAQLLEALKTDGPGTLLTMRWRSGKVKDYFFINTYDDPLTPYQILSPGSRLLSVLQTQPTASLPKEGSEQEPHKGAYVDEAAHAIWVWERETLDPRYLEALARRWPGWQIYGHVKGLIHQISLSGRDTAALRISKQQAIQELIQELSYNQGINPQRILPKLQQALPSEKRQDIKFGVGFFSADESPLEPQERRDMLTRLFQEWLEAQAPENDNT